MKKAIPIIFYTIEALLGVGAYVIYYLTRRKMGMARHVVYLNNKWKQAYPVERIRTGVIVCILILAVIALLLLLREKDAHFRILNLALTAALAAGFLGFALLNSVETMRDYYQICIVLTVQALLQAVASILSATLLRNSAQQ